VTDSGLFDVVGSESVFDGKIVQVRVDRVRMPGGAVAARETIGHDDAVAVVALDDDDRVVLIGQYRHPVRRRLWELPAGLLDVEGELPLIAAQRELAEETGLEAQRWQVLVDVVPSPGIMDEGVRIYLARDLVDVGRQGDIAHEEADLTIQRVPLADAVNAVFRGDIVNGMAVSGLLAAYTALAEERSLRPGAEPWEGSQARARSADEELTPPPTLAG
jgi:8-oxo-dGTP pyrophosphatase MutT (NUDIX family)